MELKEILINLLENKKDEEARSKWEKSVFDDAIDLIDQVECDEELKNCKGYKDIEKLLLNGAESWSQYSWGGYALIYDYDIAKHYCTPSELKKTKNGYYRPNKNEDWLDVQARALSQACIKICREFALALELKKIDDKLMHEIATMKL